jgi:hypothetical protein
VEALGVAFWFFAKICARTLWGLGDALANASLYDGCAGVVQLALAFVGTGKSLRLSQVA